MTIFRFKNKDRPGKGTGMVIDYLIFFDDWHIEIRGDGSVTCEEGAFVDRVRSTQLWDEL